MSASLAWRDEWVIGIARLDADHREMVRLFNHLVEIEEDRRNPNDERGQREPYCLLDRLQDLIDHLRQHFAVEEAFLRSIGYPETAAHATEHALHIAELVDLHRSLRMTKQPRIDGEGLESLKQWLFDHIEEDRGFARYYRQSAARVERSRPCAGDRNRLARRPDCRPAERSCTGKRFADASSLMRDLLLQRYAMA